MLILLCSILTIIAAKTDGEKFADASSGIHDDLLKKCEEFTKDTTITVNGEEYDITGYEQYLIKHFKFESDMDKTFDEWIVEIVPIELFSNKIEEFLYVGKSYGFFFDYDWDTDEYLIYLILHDFNVEKSGHIVRSITPLYYEKYLFDEGNVTLTSTLSVGPYIDDEGRPYHKNVYHQYSYRNTLYLQNVAFTGALYNLNSVNYGEEGYQPDQDNGGYFIGGSYLFNGQSLQTGRFDCIAELFVIGLGAFGGKVVGDVISAIEAIDAIKDGLYDLSKQYTEKLTNIKDYPFTIEAIERAQQIDKFGHLLKDYASCMNTSDDKNAVLFDIKKDALIQSTMYYNFANDDYKENTGFVGTVMLDIVTPTSLGEKVEPVFTKIESEEFRYDLYNESRIELAENENTDIYTLPKRENEVTFTAPENGIYTFESLGDIKSKFSADKGEIIEDSKYNQKLIVELRKGEKFDFVSKERYGEKGVYQIKTEFTPQNILPGETKALTVRAGESEFFTFDNPNGEGFNYSLGVNGNYSVSIAYEDRDNILESVSMQNIKSGARAFCESGKYILKITNNGDSDAALNFSLSLASPLDIGQVHNLEVGRNALYRVGNPKARSIIKFATATASPLNISLLDEQYNIIAESGSVVSPEVKTLIQEDKTYYLFIENDSESEFKIALEISYDLFRLTLGDNPIVGKHTQSGIYQLSLISDAQVAITATENIDLSLYDGSWNLLEAQDGKYGVSAKDVYYILATGEASSFNINVELDCTESLVGEIGSDKYRYIRFVPDKTDFYDVNGADKFAWYDEHLTTFSGKMDEGSVYYLKVMGEENAPYSISIRRRATFIPLRSSFDAANKLYYIEIEQDGAYTITTWISNGVSGTYNIIDSENNIISSNNKAGGKLIAHFGQGTYYIDMETNGGVTMLINAHNADNAQLNNTLIEGVNHNVLIKSNTDNTFVVE
ncbi:MAG: hypothetical protein K2I78_01790, partial [Clostridia bacterium]|nr:hypothetical protein [Clostridia bacterium]